MRATMSTQDNLYNSKELVVDRIEKDFRKRPVFYNVDVFDRAGMTKLFDAEKIDAVIHLVGYSCR